MKRKKACGWILISPENSALILRNRKRCEWGLPKGHTEPGEDEVTTANRELEEETGLTSASFKPREDWRRSLTYIVHPGTEHEAEKTTVLFAGDCEGRLDIALSDEHDDFRWAATKDIERLIGHEELRTVVLDALGAPK